MGWDRYLTEVLGVREVVWPMAPAEAAPVVAADPEATRILFLAEPGVTPLLEMEIFRRMLVAMKLEPQELQVWELSAVDLATREQEIQNDWVVVSFSKKLGDWLSAQRSRLEIVSTNHPADVEKNPKLKRQVWDDLKQALEKSGLSARLQS